MLYDNIKFAIKTAISSAVDTVILSTVLVGVGFIQRRAGEGENLDLLKKSFIPISVVSQVVFNVFTRKVVDNFLTVDNCKNETNYGFIQNNLFCVDKKNPAIFLVTPIVGLASGSITTKMILGPVDNTAKAVSEFHSKIVANGINSAIYEFYSAYEGYLAHQEPDLLIQKHNATRLIAAAIVAETVDSFMKHKHPGGVIDGMAIAVGFLSKDYVVDAYYGIEAAKNTTDKDSDNIKQPDQIDIIFDKTLEFCDSFADLAESLYQNIVNYDLDQITTSGDNINKNAEL